MDINTPVLNKYGAEYIADCWLPFKVVDILDDGNTIVVMDVDPDGYIIEDVDLPPRIYVYKNSNWYLCDVFENEYGVEEVMLSEAELVFTDIYIEFRIC